MWGLICFLRWCLRITSAVERTVELSRTVELRRTKSNCRTNATVYSTTVYGRLRTALTLNISAYCPHGVSTVDNYRIPNRAEQLVIVMDMHYDHCEVESQLLNII